MNQDKVVTSFEQPKYLPTLQELDSMNRDEFIVWVEDSYINLLERENERDPLFQLNKRIRSFLKQELPEEIKETMVYQAIKDYVSKV